MAGLVPVPMFTVLKEEGKVFLVLSFDAFIAMNKEALQRISLTVWPCHFFHYSCAIVMRKIMPGPPGVLVGSLPGVRSAGVLLRGS